MERSWKLDGKPIRFQDLIRRAKDYGYEGEGGIFLTSQAAETLKQNGHKVEMFETESSDA